MGAAISENGVLTHIPLIGPYNTERLVTFLDTLYRDLIPEPERVRLEMTSQSTLKFGTMSVSIAPTSSGNGLRPTTGC